MGTDIETIMGQYSARKPLMMLRFMLPALTGTLFLLQIKTFLKIPTLCAQGLAQRCICGHLWRLWTLLGHFYTVQFWRLACSSAGVTTFSVWKIYNFLYLLPRSNIWDVFFIKFTDFLMRKSEIKSSIYFFWTSAEQRVGPLNMICTIGGISLSSQLHYW